MAEKELLALYNYDEFIPSKFGPWMRFDESPALGEKVADFPLWKMEDEAETSLLGIIGQHVYTIVEFGSFT